MKQKTRTASITLIVGPMASGKSTVARGLSGMLGDRIIDDYRSGGSQQITREAFRRIVASPGNVIVCSERVCRPFGFRPDRLISIQRPCPNPK